MSKKKTLLQATPNYLTDGIFTYLEALDTTNIYPWLHTDTELIDADFYANNAGDNLISPLFQALLDDEEEEEATPTIMQNLAKVILMHSSSEWLRLQEAFNSMYSLNTKEKTTVSRTPLLTETFVADPTKNKLTRKVNRNGFKNDTASVPITDSEDIQAVDTQKDLTGSDTTTTEVDVSPETQQARIKTIIDFWSNKDYLEVIYNTVKKILTIPIYN
jgi:hypothetical protein